MSIDFENMEEVIEAAKRWEALVSCARLRPLGSAGLNSNIDVYGNPYDGYAHMGLELWTKYTQHEGINKDREIAVEWLNKFTDIAMELKS